MRRLSWWARAVPAAAFWFLTYVYLTTPDVRPLVKANPSTTAFMRLREAENARDHRSERHVQRWVPYNRISENLTRAVLAAEDSAFWQHEGIDLEQIRESMEVNLERMEFVRGASTITQQLAKNLYLSPSRNPVRKLRELLLARRIEAVLGKRRILELYLNVIEWGDGIWGAEAASRAYFKKSASALSPSEGALMAGAIINPRLFNPASPNARLARRQRLILSHMPRAKAPPPDAVPASTSVPDERKPDLETVPAQPTPDPEVSPSAPATPGAEPAPPLAPAEPPVSTDQP